jgi:hypothetical protein
MNPITLIAPPNRRTAAAATAEMTPGGGYLDDDALRSVLHDHVVAAPAVERAHAALAK